MDFRERARARNSRTGLASPLPIPGPAHDARPRPATFSHVRTARRDGRAQGWAASGAIGSAGTHRPDIEGLRAVAVVLVVLFHAQLGGISGGFVGVDVFFVLSGFLITGLLLRELESSGTVSLPAFYARRARRLLPAAALVLVVTLVASMLVMPPLLLPGIAADVVAAAAYVSNIGFAAQATDYFSAAQAPSPILHYWSLGVEEQFYLFWPALLLLVARRPSGRGLRVALTVVAVSVASFGLSLWLTSTSAPWAFFSLPTRAWELGLGAILAVAGTRLRLVPERLAAVAGWAGLGMIALAAVTLDESVPFPGTAALLPTLGATLVVFGGSRPTTLGPARLLGTAIPRFLGRISYSLYLWHWPVLVVPAVALGSALPVEPRLGLVGVAVVLAAATQRWVEDPFRRGRLVGILPRRNLVMAGALTVGIALLSLSVGATATTNLQGSGSPGNPAGNPQSLDTILNALASESPGDGSAGQSLGEGSTASPISRPSVAPSGTRASRPGSTGWSSPVAVGTSGGGARATGAASTNPPSGTPASGSATPAATAPARPATRDGPVPANLQPSIGDARRDYPGSYLDGCHTQSDGHLSVGTCLYGNLDSKTTIALLGDSHALAWFPAIERFAQKQGWRFLSLTMSTCSPADIAIWVPDWKRISTECAAWRANAIQRLVAERPAIILVTGTRGFATADASGHVLSGDARTRAWTSGIQRTLDRLIPAAGRVMLIADMPLSRVDPPVCLSQHQSSVLACATSVADATNPTWLGVERRAADRADVGFIDPQFWVCPSSPCPVVLGNFLIYRDAGHLTATFSEALANRLGSAVLADLARSRNSPAP